MIARLIETGHAYAAEGHVLFDVPSMPDYGKLAGRSTRRDAGRRPRRGRALQARPDGLRAVEAVEGGRAVMAFALGRRASGLAHRVLGDGGERISARRSTSMAAASTSSSRTTRTRWRSRRCAHGGAAMARYWLHNGFLQVEGRKMAKSEGNFVTIHDASRRLAGRGAAPQHAPEPLPPADRLDAEGAGGKPKGARPLACRGRRREAMDRCEPDRRQGARAAPRRPQHAAGHRRDPPHRRRGRRRPRGRRPVDVPRARSACSASSARARPSGGA